MRAKSFFSRKEISNQKQFILKMDPLYIKGKTQLKLKLKTQLKIWKSRLGCRL